jgi:hypothetical protein
MDRAKTSLLEALKIAAAEQGATPLFRRGKAPGLFARTPANAEMAQQAVKDGLLEIVRTETIGKTTVEWVRVAPRGLDYLVESESPVRALVELGEALALNQDGVPHWAAQMQARLDELSRTLNAEVEAMRRKLDHLSRRVLEAIDRLDAGRAAAPVTWAQETRDYLQRRHQVGLGTRCPLSELFLSLREAHPHLSIKDFHAGLKRLQDEGTLTLLPRVGEDDAPGPEYALLDGSAVYYYVTTERSSEAAA